MCTTADLFISMARRYYRRRTVAVRPKKKWASNIQLINQAGDRPRYVIELCSNSTQSTSPTPVVVKTGNFKLRLDAQVSTSGGMSITNWPSVSYYVMYLPEGFEFTASPSHAELLSFITKHPEWIMAYSVAGSNTTTSSKWDLETCTFSSRLKRNLNSGDKIVLIAVQEEDNAVLLNVRGVVRFWTCAN